jgi:hypothetical protein
MIVPKVGNFGAGTKITPAADNRVPDIVKMRDLRIAHDNGIFYFSAVADMAVISDTGRPTDICMWPDAAVFSDDAWPLNVGT